MGQLFQNFLTNALKFKGEHPPVIHISACPKGNDWEFIIKDNGIGIAPEHYDRIFIIFKQLHSKKKYSGTGIGLALCKKIIETHGGQIWVDSKVGEGTSFYFTLPAHKDEG
jgi:chemotaxis family two-component system sensor kinase Cph1